MADEVDQVKTPVKRLFQAISDDEEPEAEDSYPPPPLPEAVGKLDGQRQREPAKEFVKKTLEKAATDPRRLR